jgi:hypothetical protein
VTGLGSLRWAGSTAHRSLLALRDGCRAVPVAILVSGVLAGLYLLAPLMGGDLSAQLAHADFARQHPVTPVDFRWFGGTLPLGYSLWVPVVMAWVGTRVVGAVAAVAASALTTQLLRRAGARRPVLGGIAAAVCQASDLAEGRIAFAAGMTCGLVALLALSGRRRYPVAIVAAVLAGAANPVAALLLWLCGGVAVLRRSFGVAAALMISSGLPVLVISGIFSDGGRQVFNSVDAIRAGLASLVVACMIPSRYKEIRLGALLGVVMVGAAYLLPTPVGGNAIRLSLLFAVPVVAALVEWRILPTVLAVAATVVIQTPVTIGTLTGAGAPATHASYFAPLLDEIRSRGQLTGRVEIPELTGHWEAVYAARQVPLARGWLRQVDTELNGDVFYDHKPTATTYRGFLDENAVEYVAVPDARLTYYGRRESALIATDLPYLKEIWHTGQWTLYAVDDPTPIVGAPGRLVSYTADTVVVDAPANADVRIDLRWFSWLTVSAGGACIAPDRGQVVLRTGPATRVTIGSSLGGGGRHC